MKISVITPSYRQLDRLRLCVASVADQDFEPVEHIIQDGGSPGLGAFAKGLSEELNASFEQASEREWRLQRESWSLRIISENDEGMYDAINRGLRRSKGDVCAWLNSDEQYLPGALTQVAQAFQARKALSLLFGDAILIDGDFSALSYRRTVLPDLLHVRLVHLNTPSCATFFHRRIFETEGHFLGQQWKAIGDADWMWRILQGHPQMRCLPLPLATFQFTGENLGNSALAERELNTWRHSDDAPSQLWKYPIVLRHRLKKLWGGAYARRDVAYDIVMPERYPNRQHRSQSDVGFGWPSSRGEKAAKQPSTNVS